MNRTAFFRRFSMALATLTIASASIASEDAQLTSAREAAASDAQVAVQLQNWLDQRDIALTAQADGLITNDMRAAAAEYAVTQLVEADGLVSAQLQESVAAQLAAADGLVVDHAEFAVNLPAARPAPIVVAGGR
ncbi:hypothetical protein [Piscinibacter gummiphilus]|uniref:Peptidoglycan-binding protein n=1 Tax=Piscinibacter gummiphilus TaxID=946333 RepID=A0ABZ0CT39_9BURK|nr:hypothetical protein [Piscinibacter gummiphilus]WOB08146.1 hypothetical protein RXV79_25000 [Piscinibacter gummiphilus]